MDFGLDKCDPAGFKHGKLTRNQNSSLNNWTVKRNVELG